MTPAIRELIKILPPPTQPVDASGDWQEVERSFGTALPDDYKEFISLYGTGFIGGDSYVYNPFGRDRHSNLLFASAIIAKSSRESIEWSVERYGRDDLLQPGFTVFLDSDATLVWGGCGAGEWLFWRRVGRPNKWFVAVAHMRDNAYAEFPGETMASFLEGLLSGRISVPPPLLEEEPGLDFLPKFRPARRRRGTR